MFDKWGEGSVDVVVGAHPTLPTPGPEPDGLPDLDLLLNAFTVEDVPPDPDVSVAERAPSGWMVFDLESSTGSPRALSDAGLIDGVVAWEKVASWAIARQARLLAEFGARRPGDAPEAADCDRASVASRWAPDEVGLALTQSRGGAIIRLDHAARLADVLAPTLALLEVGRLDQARARAICYATTGLSAEMTAKVQARVLPKAPGQTLAQLRAALARAVIAADPRGAAERHRRARGDRRVSVDAEPDGMASLWALLAAPDAIAVYEWLTRWLVGWVWMIRGGWMRGGRICCVIC